MADQTIVHVGENSPEHVAFKLMEIIAHLEGRILKAGGGGNSIADRKWLLKTYVECLRAVRNLQLQADTLPSIDKSIQDDLNEASRIIQENERLSRRNET